VRLWLGRLARVRDAAQAGGLGQPRPSMTSRVWSAPCTASGTEVPSQRSDLSGSMVT